MITKIMKVATDVKDLVKDSWVTSKDFINRHPVYKKLLIAVVVYKLAILAIAWLNTRDLTKKTHKVEDKMPEDILEDAMKRALRKAPTMKADDIDDWDKE